jgi:DNA-binding HxlR family transcriptional regulator/SAM-dependent methyltransferase
VYDLVERCGLAAATRVLEVGPGTGQATRRLLDIDASIVALEPDSALAAYLSDTLDVPVDLRETALEDAKLEPGHFDLAAAASSFHWVDEMVGLAKLYETLRLGGWVALWWTLFGEGDRPDAFMKATRPLLEDLTPSPTRGEEGRPAHALDSDARLGALLAVGFDSAQHELMRWQASWDTTGIRALYGTFSPIARLDERARPGSSTALPRSPSVTSPAAWSGRCHVSIPRVARSRHSAETPYNQIVSSRTMLPVHEAPTCSVAGAAEIVGSKWTVLIVHDLSEGPRRFTELERSCAGISPRTLAERLRWLESEEIVLRQSYPESPPRVEYALTAKGKALLPVVQEMRRFGHQWLGCGIHET